MPYEANKESESESGASGALVCQWLERIDAAKRYFEGDFERMRLNMEFVAGFQWLGQEKLHEARYTNNFVLRAVSKKVAQLYARNPRLTAKRSKRLDFEMWDGRLESLQQAAALTLTPEANPADQLAAQAMLADYARGRQHRDTVDRVGTTIEHVVDYQIKNQSPSFKTQMKAMVRRAVITGVGYVRVNFTREYNKVLAETPMQVPLGERAARMKQIAELLEKGEIDPEGPEVEEFEVLRQSLDAEDADGITEINEQLIFDFPKSTSIIVDPKCTDLRDFVGANWVAHQFVLPVAEVERHFGIKLQQGKYKEYRNGRSTGDAQGGAPGADGKEKAEEAQACVYEVFDRQTKSSFAVVEGYKEWAQVPKPMAPETNRFWPIFALTFNPIEVEPGQQKASVYPPSDIDIMRSAQLEWNHVRHMLGRHRRGNKPRYVTGKGWLTDEDKEKFETAPDNALIEIAGAQPGQDINKLITPLAHDPLDPALYDTTPFIIDIANSIGDDQGTVPAAPDATATAATINEQSRIQVTESNVDDLDELLSDLASACGEIVLREFSAEVVKTIAGPGAVWPEDDMEAFVNYLYLDVLAASSGKPNKAMEISNFQLIAPILLQAGASPAFIVAQALERLDDRLSIDEAFPFGAGQTKVAMSSVGAPPSGGGNGAPARGTAAPTPAGQMPAATVPERSKTEKPTLNQ